MKAIEPSELEYEGDSALSAHTAFATNFLKEVVGQDVSSSQNQLPRSRELDQDWKGPNLPMPPIHVAFNCLRTLRGAYYNPASQNHNLS